MKQINNVVAAVAAIMLVKAYGDHKYKQGFAHAHELNKIIIDSDRTIIKGLCEKLKEKEKES